MVWLENGWIVASDIAGGPPSRLVTFRPDGSDFSELPLPESRHCKRTQYRAPFRASSGLLGLVRECELYEEHVRATYSLVSYDLQDNVMQRIGGGDTMTPVWSVAFSPEETPTLASFGDGICVTIVQLGSDGVHPLNLTIGEGSTMWSLGDAAHTIASREDCYSDGTANLPSWNPNSDELAFFASTAAIGKSGFERSQANSTLFMTSLNGQSPRPLLSGISAPQDLEWSPTGRWLAFSGSVHGEAGVWLYLPSQDRLIRLDDSEALCVAWSPEGTKLFTFQMESTGGDVPASAPVIWDLSSIVQS
jgi:WD40 repeat protein